MLLVQLALMNVLLFHVMTGSHYFYSSLLLALCFFKRCVVAFLETNVSKEVCILRYLHKNITNTIFQNKAILFAETCFFTYES